ncbi:MAG TPA: thioredoxin family protein [Candidatus Aenigmarchaeota archaeon]|nr:MAG: hypothetical protein DRN75_00535 [Nanoarchaeota archaeon]HDO79733.1 thioredoxin family protein [Candidatus Aenigmarchaeota archaeon]HEX32785.1 thioredoxin family protein [Candidatus Aenigmarchaeota archaeon]
MRWVMVAMLLTVISISYSLEIWHFYGAGCGHCSRMEPFLEYLEEKYNVTVKRYEVYFNASNNELFQKTAQAYGTEVRGVPTTFIDTNVYVGESEEIENQIERKVISCLKGGCVSPADMLSGNETISYDNNQNNSYWIAPGLTVVLVITVAIAWRWLKR